MTPARPWNTLARPDATLARNVRGPTPAQASGHPALDDVPVSGPTDPGILKADCWFATNVLPAHPACVDCKGPIPMWAQSKGLLGEQVSFGGAHARGFSGLSAAGDPDVWPGLTDTRKVWVRDTLIKLNDVIVKSTNTRCATWAPAIPAATGCFQGWFNGARLGLTKPDGKPVVLRTDGVFDQDTLDALRTVAALNPKDFPAPFPGTEMAGTGTVEKKGLSTGAVVGIGAAVAAVGGGLIYAATRGGRKGRKTRRSRSK